MMQLYNSIHLDFMKLLKMKLGTEESVSGFSTPSRSLSDSRRPTRSSSPMPQTSPGPFHVKSPVQESTPPPIAATPPSSLFQPGRARSPPTSFKITPLGRAVRSREEWNPDELQLFRDFLISYPNHPPAFLSRKLAALGYTKSVKAIENKIKNLEQALRKEAATPKEENNDQDSGLVQRIELE